jgi:putative hydrolase of the HAD superfamily
MQHTLDLSRIRAISLDLDDTLWPIWPVIHRAEKVMQAWLAPHAPQTALWFANEDERLALRQQVHADLGHRAVDLRAVRHELIRRALLRHGENAALTDAAYEVFIAARMEVQLFDDARPALEWLSARFPLVAVSNGNADLQRIGLASYFQASLSAGDLGVAKPDARIFSAAAGAVGVLPHEVLHVGDDATLDVAGAMGAGMQTVWLNREEQPWPLASDPPHGTVTSLQQLCDWLRPVA